MTQRRRIFLGAFGQPGHAFPMLALGRELAGRGHDVTYETWAHWRADVEAAGMRFLAAPEYPVFWTQRAELQHYEVVFRATGETRERMREFGPDVVVHDVLTMAPALAGELERLPVVTLIPHLFPVTAPGYPPWSTGARPARTPLGPLRWRGAERFIATGLAIGRDQLNATRRRLGLAERPELHGGLSRELNLVATFPQLEYPRTWPASVQVVGPLFWEPQTAEVPVPDGPGPLVLVAPSTAQDPHQRMLDAALRGLGGLTLARGESDGTPVRVLATTNRRPMSAPVRPAPNISLVNWLSYAQTMPQADLVICHAGHGTLVRALACGVPVLAVPHAGDMAENATRVEWAGAGMQLPWRRVSPAGVRRAVTRALDPRHGLRERAGAFQSWARPHDGAVRAADLLEQLLRGG